MYMTVQRPFDGLSVFATNNEVVVVVKRREI